ncbi:MAG: BrnT family toxin [Anaerolineae bacterium]|nr:BrnT family toxin [Anaerolineae bacterium]
MSYSVEWDPVKAAQNLQKHGVSFEEAETVLDDPLLQTYPDEAHSGEEERLISIGVSSRGRILVVIHTERGDRLRIISCRRATASERRDYAAGDGRS